MGNGENPQANTKGSSESWTDRLVRLTPLLSVLIAVGGLLITVGGFVFSVYQYNNEKELQRKHERVDQVLRIDSQLRSDLDKLSQFHSNKNLTISGADFLLRDVDELLQSKADIDSRTSNDEERKRIAKMLYNLVEEDSTFNEQRDVYFSIVVFEACDVYREYLKADPDLIWDLLAIKYSDAIEALRKRGNFITAVKYNKNDSSIQPPRTLTAPEDNDLRHFEDLVRGFEKHLRLIDSDWEQKKKLLIRFQAASCNQSLTQNRLGWSIDPNDKSYSEYSEWFLDCP